MPLLGQGKQVFGKKGNFFNVNGKLAGPRAEQIPAHANVVAQIEQLVKLKCLVADRILLHINLQSLPVLLKMRKPGLAHQTQRHDASSHTNADPRSFQLLGGLVGVIRQNLGNRVRKSVLAGIERLAKRLNLLQFFETELINVFVEWPKGSLHVFKDQW